MEVSVIVPARNTHGVLDPCLTSIRNALPRGGELIVVDDASSDSTTRIAARYTRHVKTLLKHQGVSAARNAGWRSARGNLLVFVDADVVLPRDAISKVIRFFESHPEVKGITGLLSKEHPHRNFSSQYKNLYMHYIFRQTPKEVSFLYGSLHAVRKEVMEDYEEDLTPSSDTALGQRLFMRGCPLVLLKDLEVIHLKRYTLFSLVQNDFRIPSCWGRIFLRYGGWKQLGLGGTGFAHASRRQLASVILAPAVLMLACLSLWGLHWTGLSLFLFCSWVAMNLDFFVFLTRERGPLFVGLSIPWTFVDHCLMALGILWGVFSEISGRYKRQDPRSDSNIPIRCHTSRRPWPRFHRSP